MKDKQPPRRPRAAAVIVAAGKGLRTGGSEPKQFVLWQGSPLVRHSAAALAMAGISPVVVAIPQGWESTAAKALEGLPGIQMVTGGATRQESVRRALEVLAGPSPAGVPAKVLIHDAARPGLSAEVIGRLVDALETHAAAIPVLPVVDSVARARDGILANPVDREDLFRVQTPQAFDFPSILAAHSIWQGPLTAGDDAQVMVAAGHQVALVEGDESLRKITFAADFEEVSLLEAVEGPAPVRDAVGTTMGAVRTAMGFDVHRLVEGETLWLCGVRIPHTHGLSGHSDADVAIHALVDALLGTVAAGDIGDHFPPSDPQWKGASSDRFLAHAANLVNKAGFAIANVDVTIICEAPKIGPHKVTMRQALARILGIDLANVSVKATTTERLGTTGRGEGIAAQAVATVVGKR